MPEVADLWVNLRAMTAQYKAAMREAAAESDRFAAAATAAQRSTARGGAASAAATAETRRASAATRDLSAESTRLSTRQAAAARETERLGTRAAATSGRLAAMGAEARHAAGSAGVLSGSTMRLGTAFSGARGESGKFASGLKSVGIGAAAVAVGVAAVTTKMAGDFQAQMVRLKTSANETGDIVGGKLTGNLAKVSAGIKTIAVDTGTSLDQLSAAMYRIESAGFHGSDGLKILRSAAEGARAEGADLDTVANTLDSTMNAFGFKVGDVNGVMNAMVATVARGKASMQELAGSLSTVTPIASAAGLKLQEMLGAMATMTAQGVTAKQASQNLAFAIRNLQAPSNIARSAMNAVGVDATDLSKNLGKRGLTGTFDLLHNAVVSHMGKDGMVIVKTMNDSKAATQSAQKMIQGMTGDQKRLAQQYYDGKIGIKAYTQSAKDMGSVQGGQLLQFKSLADRANGFSDMLKNGSGPAKTYADILKKMMGGANGLNTYLELSGIHAATFNKNVGDIGKAAKDNSKHVEGFAEVQKTFNFQLSRFKEYAETAAVKIGEKLLPVVQKLFSWMESHKSLVKTIAIGIGAITIALGAAAVAMLAFEAVSSPVGAIAAAVALVAVGLIYLWNTSQRAREIMSGAFATIALAAIGFSKMALGAFKFVAQGFLGMIGVLVNGAAQAFGWIPGLGGKLKSAQAAFNGFSDGTINAIDGMQNKLSGWANDVAKIPHKIKVEGDIKDLDKKLTDVKKKLDKNNFPTEERVKLTADKTDLEKKLLQKKLDIAASPKEQTTVLKAAISQWDKDIADAKKNLKSMPKSEQTAFKGDIAQLVRARQQAQDELARLHDKTVSINVNTVYTFSGSKAKASLNANGSLTGPGGVKRMADGGTAGRQAAIAPGNSWILWAETGQPEAYIPLDPAKRKRSRAITAEVVKELGGAVAWKANGGITAMASGGYGSRPHRPGPHRPTAGQLIPRLSGASSRFAGGTGSYVNVSAGRRTQMVKDSKSLIADVGAALIKGVRGTTAQMLSAVKALQTAATKLLTTNMIGIVNRDNDKLKSLGKQRAALVKQLADAEARAHDRHATKSQRKAAAKRASDIEDRISGIDKQEKGLRAEIARAKTIEKTGSAISKLIAADNKKLAGLAKQRDSVAGKLKDAQGKLADLQRQWADKKAQVSEGIMGGVTAVTAANDTGRPLNAADVLKQYQAQAQKAQQFSALLKQLKAKGLNSSTLDQLAAAGVEGGYDSALALAGGTGGQISQINALQKQTKAAADSAGTAVADSMYGAGIKSAQGLVDGLKAQQAAIEKQMLAIATSMQAAIKKALGIKSPSRVMAELGQYTAQGLAVGINSGTKHAVVAARGLAMATAQAASLTGPGGLSLGPSTSQSGGGLTVHHHHVTVHVEGSVLSERNLVDVVERGMLRKGANRSVTYQGYSR